MALACLNFESYIDWSWGISSRQSRTSSSHVETHCDKFEFRTDFFILEASLPTYTHRRSTSHPGAVRDLVVERLWKTPFSNSLCSCVFLCVHRQAVAATIHTSESPESRSGRNPHLSAGN